MNLSQRLNVASQLLERLRQRRRKGFTLIELLVVVVIIGILASVALPSFVGAQDKARNAGVQANINTCRMGLEQYATDFNGSYPKDSAAFVDSATGLRTNNYLPGNALPRSPWCKTPQTQAIAVGASEANATNIASGAPLPSLGASLANPGSITDPPGAIANYGAIEYDLDPPSQTYVVYGTGKKSKNAVIAAQVSNGGN